MRINNNDIFRIEIVQKIQNQRLLGIDFGLARVGTAVTDALHISITPKEVLLYQATDFWKKLIKLIEFERIGGIVIGIPYEENEEHILRNHIENFIQELSDKTSIQIFRQDESFSSVQAVNVMLEIGKKKKQRSKKGTKDSVAAAIILQNFLESIE